jgi:RNA polymerase sigma factor (sigma-70 family)
MSISTQNSEANDRRALVDSVADPTRFGDLFERHVVAIYRYLARRVGSDLAEDLTSATFAEAFRNRARYDAALASPRAWLFGIATTHVLHHRRSEARRLGAYGRLGAVPEEEAATEVLVRQIDDTARLDAALLLIGEELRDVVMLIAVAELTYEECAAALEIPIGTVRSRLSRARRELRGLLEEPPGGLACRTTTEGTLP